MPDMPRPRPPYLHKQITRHGKIVWYVRINKGLRTRLTAPYGTPEFIDQYDAAIHGKRPQAKKGSGTLAWAIGLYRQSSAWGALSIATRRQRDNILKKISEWYAFGLTTY